MDKETLKFQFENLFPGNNPEFLKNVLNYVSSALDRVRQLIKLYKKRLKRGGFGGGSYNGGSGGRWTTPSRPFSFTRFFNNTSKKAAELGLKTLGLIGEATTSGLAYNDFGLTSMFANMNRHKIMEGKAKAALNLGEIFTYLSPVNYVAALTQGTLDPKVGATIVEKTDPRLLFPLRLGEMYFMGKVGKGVSRIPKLISNNVGLGRTPSGKWNGYIRIGNKEYRPSRNTFNSGIKFESRPVTSVEKLFDPDRWFRYRNPKYVTEKDIKTLESFLPEYKEIQDRALSEGNYMIVPENFPGSVRLEDGRFIFTGDEGSWIQSQSENFKSKYKGQTLKIGYKGGTDLKNIEGMSEEHSPETFPEQDKGVFFAADKRYADKYNHGNKETPGFWLGFRRPYDMINGGERPFLLESEAIRYMRSIDAQPSFKSFPDKPFEILGNIWGDLSYLKDPKIMSIITKDPNKMTKAELAERVKILNKIRAGQHNDRISGFGRLVDGKIKSGEWHPLRSTHYDGYIGRDHSLRWSPEHDPMEPFGSHPESYVITKPEQASILIGNNGLFNGPAYSRKYGGKLKFKK